MRSLAQPDVMKAAALGALGSTLMSGLRLERWQPRPFPLWYVGVTVLLTSFVMWAFVFGWQERYTGRNPLRATRSPRIWTAATLYAIVAAGVQCLWFDPRLRAVLPADYPASWADWLAGTLFLLGFGMLFQLCAPLAFFARLARRPWLAGGLTVAFAAFVLLQKLSTVRDPLSAAFTAELLLLRGAGMAVLVFFYLEGGLPVALWITLIIQARHGLTGF